MTIKPAQLNFDVVIVGGGPNGLTLALALARIPDSTVLVIDSRDPAAFARAGSDSRGSALTQATQNMMKALGLWPALKPHLMEMRDILVTDGSGALHHRPALLQFTTDQHHTAAAAMIENRLLALALVEQVERTPEITLWPHAEVEEITQHAGKATVKTADGRMASATLLVGADGRHSKVRQSAGLTVTTHDHGQTALTFTLAHKLPHHGRAEEHFSPSGVCALLPLPGNRCSVVWAETPSRATDLKNMLPDEFLQAVQSHVGDHLGDLSVEGRINVYPLQLHIASALTAPRIALVGDAGHVIHPLAGLGLNLGFKDCAALAECVADAVACGEDHGSISVLDRYESWRRFDVASTVAALEGMNHLFATDHALYKNLRQIGLRTFDKMPLAKDFIMDKAAGLKGNVPRLMRGY